MWQSSRQAAPHCRRALFFGELYFTENHPNSIDKF
jgi:hypothetical protein